MTSKELILKNIRENNIVKDVKLPNYDNFGIKISENKMNEIICPNCKKAFKVDEAGFAEILKQVRDHQFGEELEKRLHLAEKEKINAVKLAEANLKNALQEDLAQKDKQIIELKAKSERELSEKLAT